MKWLIAGFVLCVFTGCASDPYMLPITDEGGRATGAAFAAHDMTFRKPMPDRRNAKPWEFYYKHCSGTSSDSHTSKTSYDCSGPYY